MSVTDTLSEREFTHGDFRIRARVEQQLIDIMERADMWASLEPFQRSAARMIAVKLSRVLCGNPDHIDSWHDIAGYAQCAASAIEAEWPRPLGLGAKHESAAPIGGDAQ